MLIKLAVTGLLVALLPLSMVWVSRDADKYRKLVLVTAFLTFDLIVFGAFTRLTDSGLGCPDWPGCFAEANPFLAHSAIRSAESLLPGGPVTVLKAWIEMIHRYVAMAIGVLIIAIMAQSWRNWRRPQRQLQPLRQAAFAPALPTVLFLFVCLQGAFGAWTVTEKLQPAIVSIHLLLGMGLLALLTWLACQTAPPAVPAVHGAAGPLRALALASAVLLLVQIGLGAWVSTNYAALACQQYPLCNGVLLPEMDFRHGFTVTRELGKTAQGQYVPFAALVAIHWVHRNVAIVLSVVLGWAALAALRAPPEAALAPTARRILFVLGLQWLTGLASIFFDWPLAVAVAHNAGAAALTFLLTMLNYKTAAATTVFFDPRSRRGPALAEGGR
jgi:cytochrome c oxidase assembly protein subunit 15